MHDIVELLDYEGGEMSATWDIVFQDTNYDSFEFMGKVFTKESDTVTETDDSEIRSYGLSGEIYILDTLSKQQEGQNIVYSPISLNSALDMYSELMEDKTGQTDLDMFLDYRDYLSYKFDNPDVYRSMNVIWADSCKADLNLDGINDAIEVKWVDMSDPASVDEKNDFVSEATNGFINSTPSSFDDQTVMDIMNVVYFEDTWYGGDMKEYTEDAVFNNADGTTTELPYMVGFVRHDGSYFKGQKSTAMNVEYANGMTYWAILPNDEDFEIEDLADDIYAYTRDKSSVRVSEGLLGKKLNVHFKMPEYEMECTSSFAGTGLNKLLTSLPIDESICPYNIKKSINQIAKVKVDKKGTKAAAATEVLLEITASRFEATNENYYFTCDRPFVYVIYDNTNDDIAFIGIVNQIENE